MTNLAAEQMCSQMNSLLVSSGSAGTNSIEHPGFTSGLCTVTQEVPSKVKGKRKVMKHEHKSLGKTKLSVGKFRKPSYKKQKILTAVSEDTSQDIICLDVGSDKFQKESTDESIGHSFGTDILCSKRTDIIDGEKDVFEVNNSSITRKTQNVDGWSIIEKDLYLKGLEIFGKNRYNDFFYVFC